MSQAYALRSHLYDRLAHERLSRRGRRALRRQAALLDGPPPQSGDDGGAGSREPRRPLPSSGPAAAR